MHILGQLTELKLNYLYFLNLPQNCGLYYNKIQFFLIKSYLVAFCLSLTGHCYFNFKKGYMCQILLVTFDLYYDLYSDLYCMLLDLGLDLHACLESQKTEVKGLDLLSAIVKNYLN